MRQPASQHISRPLLIFSHHAGELLPPDLQQEWHGDGIDAQLLGDGLRLQARICQPQGLGIGSAEAFESGVAVHPANVGQTREEILSRRLLHNRPMPSRIPGEMALVGRDEELAYVRNARHAKPPLGVVVAGHQGVGKTRLAVEAAADATSDRWSVERVDGAAAARAVPLSAVAQLAPREALAAGSPVQVMTAVTDEIARQARQRRLLLLVDDAHLLDEASLAVVRRVAALPNLFLLMTVRSDEPVPPSVVGLWKDGLAHRLELQPLSREETYLLAAQQLGSARAGAETLRQLWNRSLGNPLFLRELLLAQGEEVTGPPPGRLPGSGRRLVEVVQARLGALPPEQRRTLEVLTLVGPLGVDLLRRMAPTDGVDPLVERGLVTLRNDSPTKSDPERPTALLGHPVYGVAIEQDLTPSRARALRTSVLEELERANATQELSPAGSLRLITLRLDLGLSVEAPELLEAVRYVRAAYPQAMAERLASGNPAVDEATTALAAGDTSPLRSPDELAVTERLAREAWQAGRTFAAGLALTTVLVARKRLGEAEELIATLEKQAGTEREAAQVALARAALGFWILGQADWAQQVLLAAEERVSDPASAGRLRRFRAGIALNVGRVGDAVALVEPMLAGVGSSPPADTDPEVVMASSTAAAGLALGGQAAASIELVERFLPVALKLAAQEHPEVPGELLLARTFAARVLGRLDEAEGLARTCYAAAVENSSTVGMAMFTGVLGQVALDRGLPRTAVRRLREAEILLRECDTFGYRPFVLATLAVALAQTGDSDGARQSGEQARAGVTHPRFFDPEIMLGEAWAHAADGRLEDAAKTALTAASEAARSGLHSFEVAALHAAVRFGQADRAAPQLHAAAQKLESPLVDAFAKHAEALANHDALALNEVSATFEEIGACLLAAEASGQASAEHNRQGHRREAAQAAARAAGLHSKIEGARSPSLRLAVRPPHLTAREHEVAVLAATGYTSREIAERLVVSTRTVESHLYRAFAKLGVSDRGELSAVLGG